MSTVIPLKRTPLKEIKPEESKPTKFLHFTREPNGASKLQYLHCSGLEASVCLGQEQTTR